MSTLRSTRYEIHVVRDGNLTEMVQANSRRKDALKRAEFIANDTLGWPTVRSVKVIDRSSGSHPLIAAHYR